MRSTRGSSRRELEELERERAREEERKAKWESSRRCFARLATMRRGSRACRGGPRGGRRRRAYLGWFHAKFKSVRGGASEHSDTPRRVLIDFDALHGVFGWFEKLLLGRIGGPRCVPLSPFRPFFISCWCFDFDRSVHSPIREMVEWKGVRVRCCSNRC